MLGTEWAVRHRKLNAFGWWPRMIHRWSGPALKPFERKLSQAGGNPVDAPLWFLGAVLVAGLLAVGVLRWITGSIGLLISMQGAGVGPWIRLILSAVLSLLMAAIVVRVIASWLGAGRFNRWIRPAYILSDWIIEPISRRLPSRGMLDFSPFIAYLALLFLRFVVEGMLP